MYSPKVIANKKHDIVFRSTSTKTGKFVRKLAPLAGASSNYSYEEV